MLNAQIGLDTTFPYRGVGVQNFWRGLTPEEVREKLEEIKQIELGKSADAEVGGFPGQRIEAVVSNPVPLWTEPGGPGNDDVGWWVRKGPLDIIIFETPAGTLVITINSRAEDWDEFLPIAEEILAGIAFPDL